MKSGVLKSLNEQRKTLTSEREAGKVFNPFFEAIADAVFEQMEVETNVSELLEEPFGKVVDRNILVELLFKVSKRVLIGDMNMRREMDELSGNTEEEQYADYVWNHLMQPAYLENLFQEYPAWEKALFQVVEYFTRNIKEIIQHFDAERDKINAEFFSTQRFDKIRRITGSGSDTHCENRIVYQVELDNGEHIYHKSRVNTGVRFFNELYTQVCTSLDLLPYVNPMIMGSDYVWEKEAVYAECESEQQVRNYYVRLGIILSICHLCHGGDMHYENMVASGEFPIIIDYETLVQLPPEQMPRGEKTANHIIGESVLPIGILPFYGARSQNFNADFSGLCGGGKQIMDIKIPVIENPGKSTMCIAYKYGETGEKNNRVRLNGELVQPENYFDEIYTGYMMSYKYILEHRDEILKNVKLMDGAMFRQLFRNTQEYHMILDLSYHPEFMREIDSRREFLENALTTPLFADRPEILRQEIEDMLGGDVPYFQFNMSSKEIYNSKKVPIKTLNTKTGIEFLREQIMSRSEEDLNLQKQFMEVALRYSQVERLNNLYETVDKVTADDSMIVDMCRKIADIIYDRAMKIESKRADKRSDDECGHLAQNSERILWMNTCIMTTGVDKRHTYFMDLSDRYLYSGTMGMAVFMAAFLKICPEHKIVDLYEKIVEDLYAYTDEFIENEDKAAKMPFETGGQISAGPFAPKDKTTGVFLGEGSIVYGYQLLYKITGDVIFKNYAKKHCLKMSKYLDQDIQYDLVGGNAGAILAYLNMYDLEQDEIFLHLAKQAGDHLLAHAVETADGVGWPNISNDGLLGGFAHGCAGIMYALSRLSVYTSEEKYRDMGYRAFTYERTMNHPECGGWRDYRSKDPYYMKDFKWCHGVAGIVLGWSLSAEYFDESRKEEICQAISNVVQDYPDILIKEELGLCHGNFGNGMIGHLAEVNEWKKSKEKNKIQSLSVLHKILSEGKGNVILHEQYDHSLMTGWAGIGYGLLYELPMNLPGILDVQCK